MDGEEIESEWHSKYKSLKSKFKELKNIRIESVKTDTDDLSLKIEEHKKVHEISIKELNQQNSDLRESIQDIEVARKDIQRLKDSISSIRQKLKNYDAILKEFIDKKNFYIECVGNHKYQITYEVEENQKRKNSLIFVLECCDKGFRYHLINTSIVFPKDCEFLYQEITFENLGGFCSSLLQVLPK